MVRFPHAKINLGLSVVARRPDGYHDIETIFCPIPLYDVVEIVPDTTTTLAVTGLAVAGDPEDNLLIRAWKKLKELCPSLSPVRIMLHKNIPMGAGLGGGSADAAQFLVMMNDYFSLGLSGSGLAQIAASLGSDCPFFLQPQACFAAGKGEQLEAVSLDLSGFDLLLIHPAITIPTAWAYQQIKPASRVVSLRTLIRQPPQEWKSLMINDFEVPVFAAYPVLAEIKAGLYRAGATYAAMTGSGSTVFGLFASGTAPEKSHFDEHSWRILRGPKLDRLW